MSLSLFPFLLIAFLVRYLSKSLRDTPFYQKWNKVFYAVQIFAVLLIIVEIAFRSPVVIKWIWHILLLLSIITVFKVREFKGARMIIVAILPMFLISLLQDTIKLISPAFYETWDDYFSAAVFFAFIWMFAIWITTRKQQKALEQERLQRMIEDQQNKIIAERKAQLEIEVQERTAELLRQKDELQETVDKLQATQDQLVQQEKLASLGELTAGIAHEIQNPLNFVNNFAEVSGELLEELKEGPLKDLPDEQKEYAGEILNDLSQNLTKIVFHGKRADGIVKGMLMHSRASTGSKEPTDVNALAEEYLRLSYHGLRAKDKSFNAAMRTDFDPAVGLVELVPQDIGRVLLNLFNNAFYSVSEKKKNSSEAYEPTVWVTTRKEASDDGADFIKLVIRDNGTGIPKPVLEKVYQPFFTTKPTGQGTGLGLSISYDIITKGHGGQLKVETEEGEFAEFTIILPV